MKTIKINQSLKTQKRYQRISKLYDFLEIIPEKMYKGWREKLWASVKGPKVLEVGVGTGKNIRYYPQNMDLTAIDLTPGMLEFAKRKACELGVFVNLRLGDAEKLKFANDSFDSVAATFVFCSVPDPIRGLKEIKRVLKKDGKLFLIEHVRSENWLMGKFMDFINPIIVRLIGANINRKTVDNVMAAGFSEVEVTNLNKSGVFKLIIANK